MVKLIDEGKISHNERVHLAGKVPQVVSRGVIVTSGQPVHVAIEGPLVMMSPALPKRLAVPTVELSVIFKFLFTVTYSLVFFYLGVDFLANGTGGIDSDLAKADLGAGHSQLGKLGQDFRVKVFDPFFSGWRRHTLKRFLFSFCQIVLRKC